MTYTTLTVDSDYAGPAGSFLRDGVLGAVFYTPSDTKLSWILSALTYSGSPDTIHHWTQRDVYTPTEGFKGYVVRNDAGQQIGYTASEAFAQAIVDAMNDYPGDEPG